MMLRSALVAPQPIPLDNRKTIDLTDAPDLREGDWVEAEYSLPQAAAASGLSQYELLTLLGRRFSR